MLITKNTQYHLSDLPFTELIFKEDHLLLKLDKAIQWDNLLGYLGHFYSPNQGRPTIPLRAKIGTEIIKRLKNLSDRDAVAYVEENIYAQRFCALLPAQATGYMNPNNGLTNFRKQIGKEGLTFINEILLSAATKKPLKKGSNLIIDTTCVPLDICYPTDIRLLERCRLEILRLIDKAKKLGMKVTYRTYKRLARRVFINFSKLSRPKEKTRNKVHKQMIQFVRRNLKQLINLRKNAIQELGKLAKDNRSILVFLKELKTAENKIGIILHQQKQIYRGILHITERIVSFHKDYVRPIVRGKLPNNTEFGPKIFVALVKGYLYVVDIFRENIADSKLVIPGLRWFKQTFNSLPKTLFGDRGISSRPNNRLLKILSIHSGLQARGKTVISSQNQRRLARQRLPIEARISLVKRKFGWNRCRAKNPEHEPLWIQLGATAMNVYLAFSKPP